MAVNPRERNRVPLTPVLLFTVLGPPFVVGTLIGFPRTDLGMLCGALTVVALLAVYARARAPGLHGDAILLVGVQLACQV